jgi:hypothetical protein
MQDNIITIWIDQDLKAHCVTLPPAIPPNHFAEGGIHIYFGYFSSRIALQPTSNHPKFENSRHPINWLKYLRTRIARTALMLRLHMIFGRKELYQKIRFLLYFTVKMNTQITDVSVMY